MAAEIETTIGPIQAGTGLAADKPEGARLFKLNGAKSSASHIASCVALSWLTPQMDGLFIGSPASERRFIDRLVIAFDPAHSARLSRYEKWYRERQKLIQDCADETWLDSLETQLGEMGVAIMAARSALVRFI